MATNITTPQNSSNSFFKLCAHGTPDDIRRAIIAGANVHDADANGVTPLMYAASYNNSPEAIKILIMGGGRTKIIIWSDRTDIISGKKQ